MRVESGAKKKAGVREDGRTMATAIAIATATATATATARTITITRVRTQQSTMHHLEVKVIEVSASLTPSYTMPWNIAVAQDSVLVSLSCVRSRAFE